MKCIIIGIYSPVFGDNRLLRLSRIVMPLSVREMDRN